MDFVGPFGGVVEVWVGGAEECRCVEYLAVRCFAEVFEKRGAGPLAFEGLAEHGDGAAAVQRCMCQIEEIVDQVNGRLEVFSAKDDVACVLPS